MRWEHHIHPGSELASANQADSGRLSAQTIGREFFCCDMNIACSVFFCDLFCATIASKDIPPMPMGADGNFE